MKLLTSNKTARDLWVTILLSHKLGKDGPEPLLVIYATTKPVRADELRNGHVVCSELLASDAVLRRSDIPDTVHKPVFKQNTALGDTKVTWMFAEVEGGRVLAFEFREADAEEPRKALPASHSNGMPNAVLVFNGLDEKVHLTFFESTIESDDRSPEGAMTLLMVLVSKEQIHRGALEGVTVIAQSPLSPGRHFVLKEIPPIDTFGIGVEDDLLDVCDTKERPAKTKYGLTIKVDLVPRK